MKIKTKSGPTTASIVVRAKMLIQKAFNIFETLPFEFARGNVARMDQRKIDRQNRINENRSNEEAEIRRFVDENLENELRELAKIDSRYIEISLRV